MRADATIEAMTPSQLELRLSLLCAPALGDEGCGCAARPYERFSRADS